MKFRIDNVRLAFANLHEPRAGDPQKPNDKKFSVASLFPDADPEVTALPSEAEKAEGKKPYRVKLSKLIEQAAKDKWGAKWAETLKGLKANNRACVVSGATKAEYEGYDGNYFFNASNKTRPVLLDEGRNPLTAADGKPYSGCYANVTADLWAQDNQYGKRINASLLGVQFRADGDAFSGSTKGSEDDFEEITDGAQAEDLG